MEFHLSGLILKSFSPLSLYVKNVYIDFYALMGGFVITANCNYPEASKQNTILLSNVTAENSQEGIVALTNGVLSYSGPGNVTVKNSNFRIFSLLKYDENVLDIALFPT